MIIFEYSRKIKWNICFVVKYKLKKNFIKYFRYKIMVNFFFMLYLYEGKNKNNYLYDKLLLKLI